MVQLDVTKNCGSSFIYFSLNLPQKLLIGSISTTTKTVTRDFMPCPRRFDSFTAFQYPQVSCKERKRDDEGLGQIG
jgi:hypothetical protein